EGGRGRGVGLGGEGLRHGRRGTPIREASTLGEITDGLAQASVGTFGKSFTKRLKTGSTWSARVRRNINSAISTRYGVRRRRHANDRRPFSNHFSNAR